MVWFEVRALAGALIGLIGFFVLLAIAAVVRGDGSMLAGAAIIAVCWLGFWILCFPVQDGRRAKSPVIVCGVAMWCSVAIGVATNLASVLADRGIVRSAADRWSMLIGAGVLAVLAALAIRNLARKGSPSRNEHIVGYDR